MKLNKGWYRAFGTPWDHPFYFLERADYMIDLHQDLLSILYYSYIKDDYSFAAEWLKNFREDNVSGLLANLYFMNPEEMRHEIGDRDVSVLDMFRISTDLFKKFLPNEKVVFSIEGCDYIDGVEELEKLFQLGLRNILLVWNNPNRYGSGNRGDYGLTEEGKSFIRKAIELGFSIDLSHMNKNTFYDTIELIKEEKALGRKVKVIASHSNCFSLCSHMRNLDDEQLKALRSVDGLLGLVSYSKFVSESLENLKEDYLRHIEHAVSIMGIDRIGVSSDDMTFGTVLFGDEYGKMVFDYQSISNDLRELLLTKYSDEEVDKIMFKNVYEKLFREELI